MKPVVWVGDSKERLLEFPGNVQDKIGYALEQVQAGETTNKIKRLRGFPGVYEIVSPYARDTYRAVYVANLGDRIYILHCFQKKSSYGIKDKYGRITAIDKLGILETEAVIEADIDYPNEDP